MLIESLSLEERTQLADAIAVDDDGPIRDAINAAIWARLLRHWDQVIVRFWVLKTWRYRDLESVWVKLFGPRPQ